MNILAFFTNDGVPATGLSPTVRVRNVVTDALVVTDQAMSEVGDGFYKYDFSAYDPQIDYAIRCDGTVTLSDVERYVYGSNELAEEIDNVASDLKRTLGLMHENIYIDNPSYDTDNNLIGARVRIYSVPASVGTVSDVIGTYTITSVGTGAGKFSSWKQVKV